MSAGLFVCRTGVHISNIHAAVVGSTLGLWAGSIRQVTTGFCSPSPFSFLGVRVRGSRFSNILSCWLVSSGHKHDSARPPPPLPLLFSFPRAISLGQSRLLARNVRSQNRSLLAFPLSLFLAQFLSYSRGCRILMSGRPRQQDSAPPPTPSPPPFIFWARAQSPDISCNLVVWVARRFTASGSRQGPA